jgi:hypothetical protein
MQYFLFLLSKSARSMNHSAAGRPRSFFSLINFAFIADRRTTFAITRVFIYLSRHNNTAFIHHLSGGRGQFLQKEIKRRSEPLCPAGGPKCGTSADTHALCERESGRPPPHVSTKSNSPAAAESEGKGLLLSSLWHIMSSSLGGKWFWKQISQQERRGQETISERNRKMIDTVIKAASFPMLCHRLIISSGGGRCRSRLRPLCVAPCALSEAMWESAPRPSFFKTINWLSQTGGGGSRRFNYSAVCICKDKVSTRSF